MTQNTAILITGIFNFVAGAVYARNYDDIVEYIGSTLATIVG